ncbi:hypothetical protein [Fictibacillus sp. FJAT-27399]|uniref:hypothetical protein n=1 Tax=Fictibacillus sp. FJAT-27399 TaxID=1729689 RepID=UPI0012E3C6E8|nr:hypothetical protein [Fictibacillus sp. FJAT-27399]
MTTTGYGDLQDGTNELEWYTNVFAGTTSAAAMVVGDLACLQGVLRSRGRNPLIPARARRLLR